MKATGIVRRIDDLGRVVIPKEIRRTMRIREGDPLEIYTDAGGLVVFRKYSPMGEMAGFAAQYAEALSAGTDFGVAIADNEEIISISGLPKKDFVGEPIGQTVGQLIDERRQTEFSSEEALSRGLTFGGRALRVAAPIISAGDAVGAVLLFDSEKSGEIKESDTRLTRVAASFLGRQFEN